jgi:hypothetical protein
MKLANSKIILAAVFIGFLILQLVMAFILRQKDIIYQDNFTKLLIQILQVYSVHVAVIFTVGSYQQTQSENSVNLSTFVMALVLSLMWNVLISIGLIQLLTDTSDNFLQLTGYLKDISGYSSFLIAGVLGYFFARTKSQ